MTSEKFLEKWLFGPRFMMKLCQSSISLECLVMASLLIYRRRNLRCQPLLRAKLKPIEEASWVNSSKDSDLLFTQNQMLLPKIIVTKQFLKSRDGSYSRRGQAWLSKAMCLAWCLLHNGWTNACIQIKDCKANIEKSSFSSKILKCFWASLVPS